MEKYLELTGSKRKKRQQRTWKKKERVEREEKSWKTRTQSLVSKEVEQRERKMEGRVMKIDEEIREKVSR